MPSSRGTVLSAIALASLASSLPTSVDVPEGCAAGVHIIAAYGTEVPQAAVAGFQGLASQVSGQLGGQSSDVCYDADWSGSTDSTINWQASATWKAYTSSEMSATSSMTQEIIAYAQKCPTTKIVLLGYSMGAQVVMDTLCGTSAEGYSATGSLDQQWGSHIAGAVVFGDAGFTKDAGAISSASNGAAAGASSPYGFAGAGNGFAGVSSPYGSAGAGSFGGKGSAAGATNGQGSAAGAATGGWNGASKAGATTGQGTEAGAQTGQGSSSAGATTGKGSAAGATTGQGSAAGATTGGWNGAAKAGATTGGWNGASEAGATNGQGSAAGATTGGFNGAAGAFGPGGEAGATTGGDKGSSAGATTGQGSSAGATTGQGSAAGATTNGWNGASEAGATTGGWNGASEAGATNGQGAAAGATTGQGSASGQGHGSASQGSSSYGKRDGAAGEVALTYTAGTATTNGRFPRVQNSCSAYAARIRSYCDDGDFLCASGASMDVHWSYAAKYNGDAASWIAQVAGGYKFGN